MKKTIIRWKVYIDRARMYISYAQFLMLCLMFIKMFKFFNFVFDYPFVYLPILFIIFIIVAILIGYIDSKLGLFKAENERISSQNPILTDIQQKLDTLCKLNGKRA